MHSQDINQHEMHEHHHEHPRGHRPGHSPRARSRFGPPGFEPGSEGGPAGRGGPRSRGRGGFGPPPGFWGPEAFGPFGQGGFGPRGRGHGRRGGRARRGDVRAAALALLAEEPLNGYQIIQRIGERSGGLWRPSPGSVYPALAQLGDEGLIGPQSAGGDGRAYQLTEAGRAYVAEHEQELNAPWSAFAGDAADAANDLAGLVRQVHVAAFQVLGAGTPGQLDQARTVLAEARRSLYRILAEEEQQEAGDEGIGS